MGKIKSLSKIEVQSKVAGLEDVTYEVEPLSVTDQVNALIDEVIVDGQKITAAQVAMVKDVITRKVAKIAGLEFEGGEPITNGGQLVAAFERSEDANVFALGVEMFNSVAHATAQTRELEKK